MKTLSAVKGRIQVLENFVKCVCDSGTELHSGSGLKTTFNAFST